MYYLIIYKSARTRTEQYLNNYAFNYFNGKTEEDFVEFPILHSPEISIEESSKDGEDIIKCTFNRLDIPDGNANVTYFFKVVDNATHIYGEEINTIAVFQSLYSTVYERNPTYDHNDKITLVARGEGISNWAYLNVIAQVQQNNILEYVSYNGKVNIRPSPEVEEEKRREIENDHTALFIAVGVLAVAAIALIALILIYQYKNRTLLNQVKAVSFQQTNTNINDPMINN